jgi:hypothetical protein
VCLYWENELDATLDETGMPVFIPQSERLMVAVASPPQTGFLLNGFSPQTKRAIFSVTGLVTPIIVSSAAAG